MTSLGNPKIENMQKKDFQCFAKVCQRRSLPPIGVFTPLAEFTAVLENKGLFRQHFLQRNEIILATFLAKERIILPGNIYFLNIVVVVVIVVKTFDLAQILILISSLPLNHSIYGLDCIL